MKAAQTKTPAATPAKSTPFFSKKGGQDFFASTAEAPFFTPEPKSTIQTKLTVGKPNDPYEREADAVADKVVRRLGDQSSFVQRKEQKPAQTIQPFIQAKCNECEGEEKLQKKEKPGEKTEEKQPKKSLFEGKDDKLVQLKPALRTEPLKPAATANCAVQTKCAECEQEDKLQKKEEEKEKEPKGKLQKKAIFESNEENPLDGKNLPFLQKKTAANTSIQTKCDDCEQEEKLQKQEAGDPLTESLQHKPVADLKASDKVQAKTEAVPVALVKPVAPTPAVVQPKCAACEGEEKKGEEEEPEGLQRKPIFESNAEEGGLLQRSCRECEEGKEVFLKPASIQLDGQASTGGGSREEILAAARGELGKVQARQNDGSGKRVGSDRLLEYFHVAALGVWDDSIIETAGADMPSWCGIFSVWAHKKAGKDLGNWQMGRGVSAFGTLTVTNSPQPGDIGYINKPNQHHCIVESIEGDNIHSIDGNSGLFSEVIRNIRPRSAYSGFFTAFGAASTGAVQTKKEDDGEYIQSGGEETVASPSVEQKLSSSKGNGHSLPEPVRNNMEQSFGADFSNVKVHTDTGAAQMNKDLHAHAFTHGSDIYFNSGKFDTGSSGGQHLLAHELTHVVQQGSAPAQSVHTKPDIQKDDPPAPPAADHKAIGKTVYDALEGWTTSGKSATILKELKGKDKTVTDLVIIQVARLANISKKEVFEWMQSDMVTSDWKHLRDGFILVKVDGVESIIADNIYDLLSGYTSEDDSHEILGLFMGNSPLTGAQMTLVLSNLMQKAKKSLDDLSDWIFGDMTLLDADQLSVHFFNSGSIDAVNGVTHWRVQKIYDLLAGWTGADDSQMVVTNFERTPPAAREYVYYKLDEMCEKEWGDPASKALMDNMWQSDYMRLQVLLPKLPPWKVDHSWLGWVWVGIGVAFDYVGALVEYAVCGVAGAVVGILSVIKDLVVMVWDLIKGVYNFLGWVLHQISNSLAREQAENFSEFFTSMGKFFGAPGAAIAKMWGDLVLESKLIEGPFRECRQAYFWMTRIANLLVNIILVLAGGYGLVKMVASGIEALVDLVRTGKLLAALGKLPSRMYSAIKGLPGALARATVSGIGTVVKLVEEPALLIQSVQDSLMAVRLAAEQEGYYNYLRGQAGKLIEKESEFWRERKDFWKKSAEKTSENLGEVDAKLANAVDVSVDDPGKAEALIKEAGVDAKTADAEAQDLLEDVKGGPAGDVVPDFESRLPEKWRTGSPQRPALLNTCLKRFRALNISDDVLARIINVVAVKAPGSEAEVFFAAMNRLAINGETRLARAGLEMVLNGLANENSFATASLVMQKVGDSTKPITNVVRVFNLDDIAALRARYPTPKNTDFFNNLETITSRINGTKVDITGLLTQAGDGEKGMDELLKALRHLEEGQVTPKQVQEAFEYSNKLEAAVKSGKFEEIARGIWGEKYGGIDPETGKIKVADGLTGEKLGDKAPAFINARAKTIADMVLGGEGGTEIDMQRWAMIRDSIAKSDVPGSLVNNCVGEIWATANVRMWENRGWEVIREVALELLKADGTDAGVGCRLDAVLKKDGKFMFKEFKSGLKGGFQPGQEEIYPVLEAGSTELIRPSGPRAEQAFGKDMQGFKAQKVDVERPVLK